MAKPEKIQEQDLYPRLAEFLFSEHNIYSKRINEKTSSNKHGKNGNKWLHPDMVGLEDLSQDWTKEVKECAGYCGAERVALWSFEVKLKLNSANLRESFFQAVSNSSWAHYGYLAAAEIDKNCESELALLVNSHNIGVILLNTENPTESQILLPCPDDRDIDWDMCSRIAKENKDFREYIICVYQFHQTGNIKDSDWLLTRKHN